jgi:molybdopterin adenylyltransferase
MTSPLLAEIVRSFDWLVVRIEVVPDEFVRIVEILDQWIEKDDLDIILTTGGTGFSQRDVTPEATSQVIEREAPGLAEAMRFQSSQSNKHAILSRGIAGICKNMVIINLPGSPTAAIENFRIIQPVLSHAVEILRKLPESEDHHRFHDPNLL